MNRLVIIGNGFDLAHGLPTSYKDFIDDYWKKVIRVCKSEHVYNDGFLSLNINIRSVGPQGRYDLDNNVKCYKTLNQFIVSNAKYCTKEFKNKFFLCLSDVVTIENWVDIENLYYSILKERVKGNFLTYNYPWDVKQLNLEFEQVKILLEKYLIEEVENQFDFSEADVNKLEQIFKTDCYEGESLEHFFKEIYKKDEQSIKRGFDEFEKEFLLPGDIRKKGFFKDQLSLETHFLSFNYTSTVSKYIERLNFDSSCLNEIHGSLISKDNLINFGFGDEMDKHYQEIEEKNDNEYLRNIKSFQYLHTPNYKRLLDLIDSEMFQVYIMGHSCGLSDRTLLNTIFEHENCCSIKVFYHEIKDANGQVIRDNYTEITQNISRHFNKKKLMREKIVNKTLCQPLPQIQIPLK